MATALTEARLPRIVIRFCTQCKWNLRAAYFAQELLQTFSTALGEVSLQPSGGGIFVVEIFYAPEVQKDPGNTKNDVHVQRHILWDRAVDGGFPETKILKRRVRDIIEPSRDLGHVDRHDKPAVASSSTASEKADTPAKTKEEGSKAKQLSQIGTCGEIAENDSTKTHMTQDSSESESEGPQVSAQTSCDSRQNEGGEKCEDCN